MVTLPRDLPRTVQLGACLVAAALLAGLLLRDVVPPLDAWIVGNLYQPPGTVAAVVATAISGAGTLLGIGALLVGLALAWRHGSFGLLLRHVVVLAACAATVFLQMVFVRPGPPQTDQDWTYPSGHVVVITALACTAVLAARSVPGFRPRPALALAGGAVLLVAASRVVLAEHWLLDVAGAAAATTGVGLIAAFALRLTGPDLLPRG